MLVGDPKFGSIGALTYNVAASATLINPGEPCLITLGTWVVSPMATGEPTVATDYLAGIAVSTSTNTATAAGKVQVRPIVAGQIYEMAPNVAITSQTIYDGYLGYRVLIDLTSTTYTILVADNATYGCIILPNNLARNPGKVRFTFRAAVSNLY